MAFNFGRTGRTMDAENVNPRARSSRGRKVGLGLSSAGIGNALSNTSGLSGLGARSNARPLQSLSDITNLQERDARKPRQPLAARTAAAPAPVPAPVPVPVSAGPVPTQCPVVPRRSERGLGLERDRILDEAMDVSNERTERNTRVAEENHARSQAAAEYLPEIMDALFNEEVCCRPRPSYMEIQPDINGKMRAILVDWLVEVHMKYRLREETLFLAVNLIDRYLSSLPVIRRRLQLVGVTAMFVAAKFEEINPPRASNFVYITDSTYSKEELLQMECAMLNCVNFQVVVPTAAHFLHPFLQANNCDGPRHRELIKYVLELALLDLRMIRVLPSELLAAAVLLGNELMARQAPWPRAMELATRHTQAQLRPLADELHGLLRQAPTQALEAVRKKYMLQQHHCVASAALAGA
mmetsp:Transcript_20171/g.47714  ORF Transcript_20171/g.47714 Transcript_20171/m.47714 type:complete len:411 (+) Transcript_20171:53-1285(+)|eukprot:CAMPEP_0181430352 /NCGR_PEP_ID=MMETSP1110-20121109/17676_1 /TAXON_ID=174948 /ORGANISM="Symbiodinium sp., Strain CCMP421" /LENGTH=410 /DNA_ID=CAMNT_0023553659 /DNA_START=43 /DNA_END=1275 /DNA_ORIENTATION=+